MLYYQQSIDAVLIEVKSSMDGLSQAEARQRLADFGPNQVITKTRINKLRLFLSQFQSFLIYILLFAVLLSLFSAKYIDALIVFAILLINAFIGFFQELSAQKSLEMLKQLSRTHAKVWRDHQLIEVDSIELVVGDVIALSPGDQVPADCRLIDSHHLKVQESALTGESKAVNKNAETIAQEVQLGDRSNMLFSSTSVIEGEATAVVVKTAESTEIGSITQLIRETEEELTPLQKKLDAFGKKLSWAILSICLLIFFIIGLKEYVLVGFSFEAMREIALISVALAVAAVPEGLPAVVTISLSIGVKKLLKKRVLVKRLSSVETLGSCDVICTDKTGTLTRNEMMVSHAWSPEGESSLSGIGYEPKGEITNRLSPLMFEIGLVCNNASVFEDQGEWQIAGDPTEAALIVSAMKMAVNSNVEKISTLPFDTIRKKMSVLVKREQQLLVFTKGAPDPTLDDCSQILIDGQVQPLSQEMKQQVHQQISLYGSQALRVLAFAYKPTSEAEGINEQDLIFVGLQAMIDPPRKDVVQSIALTKRAGIRVIMITGDYKETAIAVANKVGIHGECMEGKMLPTMSDHELQESLQGGVNIFSRTVPADKQRIVTALQQQGSIVAMTGDGINDAPALKKADIGVAVGSGTDVAKEASDFVLFNNSFTHIVNAIEEGRGIYSNIQKTIMLLLSGNLCEILIVFVAVVLGWDLPLTVIMILWINLISDGAPALAMSVDRYGEDIMQRQPKAVNESILTGVQARFIVFLSVIVTACTLWLFKTYSQDSLTTAQTMVFNMVFIAEVALIFTIRSWFKTPQATNLWLWLVVLITALLQLLIMYSPLANIFAVAALKPIDLGRVLALGLFLLAIGLISVRLLKGSRRKEE